MTLVYVFSFILSDDIIESNIDNYYGERTASNHAQRAK